MAQAMLLLHSISWVRAEAESTLGEPCHKALVKDIFDEDHKDLMCQTPSGLLYRIPTVDNQWIEEHMLSGALVSGETRLDIPSDAMVDPESATLLLSGPPRLINEDTDNDGRQRRRLTQTTGDRTVLAVRVVASNDAFSKSEYQLSQSVFDDAINLKSQYAACSHGKLNFQKRPNLNGRSTNVRNGVVTITVGMPVQVGHATMVNAISQELVRQFGKTRDTIAHHVMYCLPPGTMHGVAYGYYNEGLSVYNDDWCTSVSAQMHEIG